MLGGREGRRCRAHPEDSVRRADRQMGEGLRWGGVGAGEGEEEGGAGCGERGPTERPPSVGDGGDRQAVAAVLRGKGGTGRRADSCP